LCKENAVLIYFKYAGAGLLDRNGGDGGDGEVKLKISRVPRAVRENFEKTLHHLHHPHHYVLVYSVGINPRQ
jgi:hypothetical protein